MNPLFSALLDALHAADVRMSFTESQVMGRLELPFPPWSVLLGVDVAVFRELA
jgi:hypothetical protein